MIELLKDSGVIDASSLSPAKVRTMYLVCAHDICRNGIRDIYKSRMSSLTLMSGRTKRDQPSMTDSSTYVSFVTKSNL